MRRAWSSHLFFFFAALLLALRVYASEEILTERIQYSVRGNQGINLAEIFRVSPRDNLEILSLEVIAQSYRSDRLDIFSEGRRVSSLSFRARLSSDSIEFAPGTLLQNLDLMSMGEVYIENVIATVRRMRPHPHQGSSIISVRVHRNFQGQSRLNLIQLARQQTMSPLIGLRVESVEIESTPLRGPMGQVQIEMNQRMLGAPRVLQSRMTSFPIGGAEALNTLFLHINGSSRIEIVHLRVREDRDSYGPGLKRAQVGQEISAGRRISLLRLFPRESRLVSSLVLNARATRSFQSEVALVSIHGEFISSVMVTQVPLRPVLELYRPMPLSELELESFSPVVIESLELEFAGPVRRY
jgi:hypothetical protein